MSLDLSQIFDSTLTQVEQLAGEALGGLTGNSLVNQSTEGVKSTIPDWLQNTLSGFFSGFSSTEGGQETIKTVVGAATEDTVSKFFKSPIPWIILAGGILIFGSK
jgi:hypothetical protein